MSVLLARSLIVCAALGMAPVAVWAQAAAAGAASAPMTAPVLEAASAAAAGSAPAAPSPWLPPSGAAKLFQRACLDTAAKPEAATDWALSAGFEPVDPMRGSSMDSLLAGQPGSVLVAPGTRGTVMLVVAGNRQCTVWIDQANGAALRLAVIEMLNAQVGKSARVQQESDQNVEKAGAWRNQSQWRYKAITGRQELLVNIVTTLAASPGTQALNAMPAPASPAFAPDGVPTR